MNIKAYLERVGLSDQDISRDIEFLKKLQYAHILCVPYENLDILNGEPLSLECEDLYRKIVVNRRGGYCFEVNGLLSYFLKEIGFEVHNYAARYLRGEQDIPVRRHRVLSVKCDDGYYLCDVGIGQIAPKHPLKIEEGIVQEQFGEVYRFEKDGFYGWKLCELHKGEWRPFYAFTEEEQLDIDFIQPSFYCEKHHSSPFNKDIIVAIKTEQGRKTLNGNEYKVFSGEELSYIEENLSAERRYEVLEKEFGIIWRYRGE